MKKNSFLIAATSSGSGKTTLSLGLMRALSRTGLRVQPFKCGPDYIDTQYHTLATGRNSINLDLFMSSESHVKDIYTRYGVDSDVNIVEGVMGMF
ncbi:MAG: AAA family ATPase, partial [Duncaniella sp.]|nr:AAA family ATPase [Duncaniella sp.]